MCSSASSMESTTLTERMRSRNSWPKSSSVAATTIAPGCDASRLAERRSQRISTPASPIVPASSGSTCGAACACTSTVSSALQTEGRRTLALVVTATAVSTSAAAST